MGDVHRDHDTLRYKGQYVCMRACTHKGNAKEVKKSANYFIDNANNNIYNKKVSAKLYI